MNKTVKKAVAIITCSSLVILGGLSATSAFAQTKDDVLHQWGHPYAVKQLDNGMQKLFYHVDSMVGDRYFVVKDGRIVEDGLGTYVPENGPIEYTGEAYKGTEAYYAAHPTSADDILATWGTPSKVVKLNNGKEELYFTIDNTAHLGDRVFVIKDGMVVAGGIGQAPVINGPVEHTGLAFNSLSKAYYAAHPTTVNDVTTTWGTPVKVQKLNNGKEELFFKIQNTAHLGTVCFLIQDGKVIAQGMGM